MPLTEVVFEVPVAGALGSFTRDVPDARALVRFVGFGPGGARVLLTLAGPTERTAGLVRALRDELAPGGEAAAGAAGGDGAFTILSITPYSVVLRATAPLAAPWVAPVARFVEVFGRDTLLEPALVERGRMRVKGTAAQHMDTRGALEKLQELPRVGGWDGFRVVHVTAFDPKLLGERRAALLDGEQDELLRLAVVMGYYDTPRRCNLEDIAARVGLSVSPVHKRLKEVEHLLIRTHLEPGLVVPPRKRRANARPRAPSEGTMREVTVRVACKDFGPAAFTERFPAARVVYQPLGEGPDGASHLFIVLAGPEPARAFLRTLEADRAVAEVEVLSRDPEHVSLRVRRRPLAPGAPAPAPGTPAPASATAPAEPALGRDPLAPLVAALGRDAYLKPAVCEGGAVLGRVVLMRRLPEEELAATLAELAAAEGWAGAELVGVRDLAVEGALLAVPRAERMTGRQEEVLRIAHALGYYRTPRGCTLEDVAGTLGVSANAVHKNLAAAEQRIIQAYIAGGL